MFHNGNLRAPIGRNLSRRGFLQTGAIGLAGMGLAGMGLAGVGLPGVMRSPAGAAAGSRDKIKNCITLFLVGSPGHLDTWDMKPEAPAEVRGPFKPIATNVPGVEICEHFPRMARVMDKVALIRGLHHDGGTTHGHGQRRTMTGRQFTAADPQPHQGSVIARLFGARGAVPPSVILPSPIGETGGPLLTGQFAAYLGAAYEPYFPFVRRRRQSSNR